MILPATAGRAITEEELRTYAKCSQLHHFGGKVELPLHLAIAQQTFERVVVDCIRNQSEDPVRYLQGALSRSLSLKRARPKMLEGQVRELQNQVTIWVGKIFEILPPNMYLPVSGPIEPRMKVGKSVVDLHISALFRSRRYQTVHAVGIVPYSSSRDILSDIPSMLKLRILEPLVKKHFATKRPQARIHLFAWSEGGGLRYENMDSNQLNEHYLRMVENLVGQIETEYHFPLLPCGYGCPFKDVCIPKNLTGP